MKIIRNKTLDDLSKKLDNFEQSIAMEEEEKLNHEEKEKLDRFSLYQLIRMEKYIRKDGNPDFGNLDGQEYTAEEFEYHLSHCLNDYAPQERYHQRKEMYYFHPSYIEMEELDYWRDRAEAKCCTGPQCIPDCPYYNEIGRIEDELVIAEFIDSTEIVEIEDYKAELGDELVSSIIREWYSTQG